jgi:hypothetical protein
MALEETEVEQPKEEAPRERPDRNHVMMGGKLVRDNDFILSKTNSAGNDVPLQGLLPDGTTGDLHDQRKLPIIDTASVDSFMGNFADLKDDAGISNDSSWNSQAGMSMDGMFIPYATEFVTQGKKGSLTNIPIPSGSLPSFEKPVGIGNQSLTDWWNVGSGIITSATLNPLASGHGISLLVRNANRTDLNVRKTGGGYALGSKKLGQTTNITETDLSESNQHARPVGLRGPLVVSGWGYDTEGHPVPNAKFEADRREEYTMSGGGGVDNAGLPPELQHDKPRAHFHFLDSHLKRVDRWKSGPVDLRWDRERKVWVGGKFNGIYLSKAVKCILPQAGIDGKNSFNFGINNQISNPGRLYRNPCPQSSCSYETYFNTSNYYPDIEIYDPEDIEWCGNCEILNVGTGGVDKYVVNCTAFSTTCQPFYDAIIIRSVDHTVAGRNTYSSCGDKFSKTAGGEPQQRRAGDPCHRWGGSAMGGQGSNLGPQPIHGIMPPVATGASAKYAESAKAILYQKILIENPLNQGLMLGDSFLSYDTGRKVTVSYARANVFAGCGVTGGAPITVQEVLPVHVILQAEFFSAEVMTYAGCGQGEFNGCTRKLFFQGMSTMEDCGPDDDYPQTAII